MKRSILIGLACVLLGTGSANARSVFVGNWESLDGDNRQFRIVETDDGFKMTAPGLSCDYKVVLTQKEQRGQFQVKAVCADEGVTTYSSGQIKAFKWDYLVIAETVYRRINYGKEEKLKKPELFVYLYRRTPATPPDASSP